MYRRYLAMALASATIALPVDRSAADETRPFQVASIVSPVPKPRVRAVQAPATYRLAALPSSRQVREPALILPPHLPRQRASLAGFRLLTPPTDIRITAPPAGKSAGRWGTAATPRKPDIYAAASFCMAKAIYYEARGEPLAGRLAVGRVVLNRVKSRFYPNTVCEVVYQNAQWRNRCQFSFACDGKPDVPRHMRAWNDAVDLAEQLLCRSGQACRPSIIGGQINISTHYHATYVKPRWSSKLPRTGRIGQHIFYFTATR